MNKEAEKLKLKRLVKALTISQIIPELEEAKKATEDIYEGLNELDIQSNLEYLGTLLRKIEYNKKSIGEQSSVAHEYLDRAVEAYLKLNNLLREEIKKLKEKQKEEEELEEPSEEEIIEEVAEVPPLEIE